MRDMGFPSDDDESGTDIDADQIGTVVEGLRLSDDAAETDDGEDSDDSVARRNPFRFHNRRRG